SEYPDEQKKID
ncbi:unnamed protein product, partial [Rotaria socialis]